MSLSGRWLLICLALAAPLQGQVLVGFLGVQDADQSHTLSITLGTDLSSNRTLQILTGDADRTLTIAGDATISGTNTGDQILNDLLPDQTGNSGRVLTTDGTDASWQDAASTAANPSASIGLTAVHGSASTYMRSDAAPALDQSISPAWTGDHHFRRSGSDGSPTMLVGADFGSEPTDLTDNTNKYSVIAGVHYDTDEEPIRVIGHLSTSGDSQVNIGGGNNGYNAAMRTIFYAAANTTTLGGQQVVMISLDGLGLRDTNNTHYLNIAAGSNLTATRSLSLVTGDSNRTITLSGNPTLADWFDQSVKTSATPVFAVVTATRLHLRDSDESNVLRLIAGSNLSATRDLTILTADSDRTITLSGNPTLNDWFDQGVKTTDNPSFAGIDSTPIGATTPSTGAFTTLSASGTTTLNGGLAVTGLVHASSVFRAGSGADPGVGYFRAYDGTHSWTGGYLTGGVSYVGTLSNHPVGIIANNGLAATFTTSVATLPGALRLGGAGAMGNGIDQYFAGNTQHGWNCLDTTDTSGAYFAVFRKANSTVIGSITRNGSSDGVLYNTTSDRRLKTNIRDADSSQIAAAIEAIQVRSYEWRSGGASAVGFIAQELAAAHPVLVELGVVTPGDEKQGYQKWQNDLKARDEVRARNQAKREGYRKRVQELREAGATLVQLEEPQYEPEPAVDEWQLWQVDYSKLVPLLVDYAQQMRAELKTQSERIDAIEARLALDAASQR